MSRIAPLQPPYAPDIQGQFDRIMRGAPPLLLFRVVAGHARAWEKFRAGGLLEMLEQFATRGINMSLLQSRPIGDALGRYRFVIDLDGHILDERIADALLGLKRFSPNVIFLGSYPRADKQHITVTQQYGDDVFIEARDWLRGLIAGTRE